MSWRSDDTPRLGWPTPTSGSSRNVRYARSASLKFRKAPPSIALSSAPWTKTQCDWRQRPALPTKEVVSDQTEPGPHLESSSWNALPCGRPPAVHPGINAKPAWLATYGLARAPTDHYLETGGAVPADSCGQPSLRRIAWKRSRKPNNGSNSPYL